VKFSGLAELHAAFLIESRTRCRRMDTRTGNLDISPDFGEIWEISQTSVSYRNMAVRFPTSPHKKRCEIWAHTLVVRKELGPSSSHADSKARFCWTSNGPAKVLPDAKPGRALSAMMNPALATEGYDL
jgi:hypothetical protein